MADPKTFDGGDGAGGEHKADPGKKPDDRIDGDAFATSTADPKIFVVVDGRRFPRPGLETYFASAQDGPCREHHDTGTSQAAIGTYCSCNKVCSCVPVCGCVGYKACGCVGHISHCYGGGYGCRCAPVH